MDEWKFDSFELDRVTDGRPLSAIAFAVLKRCDLVPGRCEQKCEQKCEPVSLYVLGHPPPSPSPSPLSID